MRVKFHPMIQETFFFLNTQEALNQMWGGFDVESNYVNPMWSKFPN